MVCVGRYFRNPAGSAAEVALTVHDDFQNRGIGTFLIQTLSRIALENGISAFTAYVLADNHAMLRAFHKASNKLETKLEAEICRVHFDLCNGSKAKNACCLAINAEPERRPDV
jgi:RimJ/RimL family protein N-acetyltransferase